MTTASIYEVRELDRAEELLAELAPATGQIWRDADWWVTDSWIFRGANSRTARSGTSRQQRFGQTPS